MKVVALAGGVGGAKLADGLYEVVSTGDLTVVVNTGDDFDLFGLRICPDADTVVYTLAGIANPATGWGIAGDSWQTLDMLGLYGEDTWFRLGDRDFATHLSRTARLTSGERLTTVMDSMSQALGVHAHVLPMCDEPVPTRVRTPEGELAFQDYFVRRQQHDTVTGIRFEGMESARVTPEVATAIAQADVIVLCPSNPLVSIGPILAVPGLRDALLASGAVRVGISPLVGGRALKGPADRMLRDLGHDVSSFGIAKLYAGLLHGFVLDEADAADCARIEELGMRARLTGTVMRTGADRARLAEETLAFARGLRE
ncbi:MAG TPA: 2-phospho-L-lactate transferase [Ktedonobacterales bacterium]